MHAPGLQAPHETPPLVFDLDPQAAQRHKAQRAYQLNVIQTPLLRLVGYSLLLVLAWGHNQWLLPTFAWTDFVRMATLCAVYSGLSWLVLWTWYERVQRVD